MPIILMVGLPSTGKTTRAQQVKCFLENDCSTLVHLISENDILKSRNIEKNKFYLDSQKEKEIRGVLKSEALRLLGKESVVILDAGNYIKGYRYELYCATKNYKTTQLTIECVVDKETSWSWNEERSEDRYSREVFDALHLRYEAPDSRNRWDSPLICLQDGEDLKKEEIKEALFSRKPPPPNQSTQSTPISSSDYLYELDKITKEIVDEIVAAKKSGACETSKFLPSYPECDVNDFPDNLTTILLVKLRRQFLNYTKLHPPSSQAADPSKMAALFIQFLKTSLSGES